MAETFWTDPVFYVAQERAFCPGIVKEWPSVVRQPRKIPNGRLVRVNLDQVRAEVLTAQEKAAAVLYAALEAFAEQDECGIGVLVGEREEHTAECDECQRILTARAALAKARGE